jgi:hypothetical protein
VAEDITVGGRDQVDLPDLIDVAQAPGLNDDPVAETQ